MELFLIQSITSVKYLNMKRLKANQMSSSSNRDSVDSEDPPATELPLRKMGMDCLGGLLAFLLLVPAAFFALSVRATE
jgi:hypothetical protein